MIGYLESLLGRCYFYFCPRFPGKFFHVPGKKRPFSFLCELTDFVWKKAGKKFTQSKKGVKKENLTAKIFPRVRGESTGLLVFSGEIQNGHSRRKFSFNGFQNLRINIIEESLILAQDERWRHA